jgi:hypothetical protein
VCKAVVHESADSGGGRAMSRIRRLR